MSNRIAKPLAFIAQILLLTLLGATVGHAGTEPGRIDAALNQRVKQSLNSMVRDVHEAEAPSEKRAVLGGFLEKAERGAALAGRLPFLSDENHAALNILKEKFDRYSVELHGVSGSTTTGPAVSGVPDGALDAYASYVQQDLEQAADGGIYLSTGAIIIALLIILILI